MFYLLIFFLFKSVLYRLFFEDFKFNLLFEKFFLFKNNLMII